MPEDILKALAAMNVSQELKEWLPDTSATTDMTGDTGKVRNLVPYSGSNCVMVGNGNKLKITHVGDSAINAANGTIPLNKVLVDVNKHSQQFSVECLID